MSPRNPQVGPQIGLLLLFLLSITATRLTAQDQAPSIVTLVPTFATQASVTLRAEVNPNGLRTDVELAFVTGGYGGSWVPTQSWVVSAGSGNEPIVVEKRLTGLEPYSVFIFRAKATNAAGSKEGLIVPVHLKKRTDIPIRQQEIAPPMAAHLPPIGITERSATIRAQINPNGHTAWAAASLSFYKGAPTPANRAYVLLSDLKKVGSGDGPIDVEFPAASLYRGMTYRVTINTDADAPNGGGYGIVLSEQTFTTLGEPGRNPPDITNAAVRVPIGSTESVTQVVGGFDPDGDIFAIESTSPPLHGQVTFDAREWTYTPDVSYNGQDQFSITVADTTGEKSTCVVQIYDVRPKAFAFDLGLEWNASVPPRPAGRLTLSVTAQGTFTGRVSIFGATYPLQGTFDPFDEAVLELDRNGLPPLLATLKLLPGVDGEMHLDLEIQAPELSSSYTAQGLPVGDADSNEGVAGVQYSVILPFEGADSGAPTTAEGSAAAPSEGSSTTPLGHGFTLGSVTKKGRARFAGRTGDGQPFTFGGRLQRNRQLHVGIAAGGQPRDYIVGHLQFQRDESKSVDGLLGWLSFRRPDEYYASDFSRMTTPLGAAYQKPAKSANVFGEAGGSSDVHIKLLDGSAATLAESNLTLDGSGKGSIEAGETTVNLHFYRRSGLIRGYLRTNGSSSKAKFTSALVQPLKRGQGHILLNGPVGGVTISASTP